MARPDSPICAELRSKKYFFLERAPMSAAKILDNANDCWCNKTCDRLGPDGEQVHPDACRSERACFRSIFTVPTP